jgi:hypothetical protein
MNKGLHVLGAFVLSAVGATTFASGAPTRAVQVRPVWSDASRSASVGLEPVVVTGQLTVEVTDFGRTCIDVSGGAFEP